jgi:hypothetical protein
MDMYSILKMALWISFGVLSACGGSKTGPIDGDAYAAEMQVDVLDNGLEIRSPSVLFEGQPAQIEFSDSEQRVFVASEHLLIASASPSQLKIVPLLVGAGEHELAALKITLNCCTAELSEDYGWSRPVYQYPIELGDPITLRAGSDLILSAVLSNSFLDNQKDDFELFTWKQIEGPDLGLTNTDSADLTLKLPKVSNITRLRFQLSAKSIKGKVFRREKIVFVVPEAAWLVATHIDQGVDNTAVAREDGSIVHLSFKGELKYSISPFANLKQLENSAPYSTLTETGEPSWFNLSVWALAETGELRWFSQSGEWLPPLQDLPRMAKLFGVFNDARFGTQMIDQSGSAYAVGRNAHDSTAGASQALSVSHRYLSAHTLLQNGELVDGYGMLVTDNIAEIANRAFRRNDGRIGIYEFEGELHFLDAFDQYNDIIAIASVKRGDARFPLPVFALRDNGDVVGVTPKSPALSKDLTDIRELDFGHKLALALKDDGTVIQWRAAVLVPAEINSILSGDKPSPFNIRESFYQ